MKFRKIQKNDNQSIAKVIRIVLEEHGVDRPGTVYTDPTTDDLFSLFKTEKSIYWIAEEENEVLGGCGIYPTKNLPKGYVELVKLYLSKKSRGKGIGRQLMLESIQSAKEFGYSHIYLETTKDLSNAIQLYKDVGFKLIDGALGDSGHFSCEIRMVMQIQ